MSDEKMFWADHVALELKKTVEEDPVIKEIYDKHGLLIYDE